MDNAGAMRLVEGIHNLDRVLERRFELERTAVDSVGERLDFEILDHQETDEYIKTVESHLNAVIQMFERHLREDHGQKPS
jgi:hypothetical protein